MATDSTVTYTPELVGDLDVISIYKDLMEASTSSRSVYIRTKETLIDMFATTTFTDQEKATVTAQTLSSIATSITSTAMEAAIKIATENRDSKYVLTKLREDTKLTTAQAAKIESDIAKADKDTDLLVMKGWQIQADLRREYGLTATPAISEIIVPSNSFTDYGIKVETLKKAKVDTYATYSNSYRTNGNVSYTADPTTGQFTTVGADTTGLTVAQTNVAIRQEQGFDDNQRQHMVNSSASMVGLLVSSESYTGSYAPYLDRWIASADYLNTSHTSVVQVAGSVDIGLTTQGILDVSAGHTMSGTVTGISPGRSVTVVYRDVAGIAADVQGTPGLVLMDNTWSSVLPTNKSADLVAGVTYQVTASIVDHTGNTVKDVFSQAAVE